MSKLNDPRHRHDKYFKKAREQGFAARSVFKLEEIDERLKILKTSYKVLDLGAAPGSWSQYACKKVGMQGRVLAGSRSKVRRR